MRALYKSLATCKTLRIVPGIKMCLIKIILLNSPIKQSITESSHLPPNSHQKHQLLSFNNTVLVQVTIISPSLKSFNSFPSSLDKHKLGRGHSGPVCSCRPLPPHLAPCSWWPSDPPVPHTRFLPPTIQSFLAVLPTAASPG